MSLVFAQPPILNFWPVMSKNYHSGGHQVKAYETIPPTSDKVLDKKQLGEELPSTPPPCEELRSYHYCSSVEIP